MEHYYDAALTRYVELLVVVAQLKRTKAGHVIVWTQSARSHESIRLMLGVGFLHRPIDAKTATASTLGFDHVPSGQ